MKRRGNPNWGKYVSFPEGPSRFEREVARLKLWQNRTQFFAVAAQIMRRILVDHARSRAYQKRAGAAANVPLDIEQSALIAPERGPEFLALDSALERLAAQLGGLHGMQVDLENRR